MGNSAEQAIFSIARVASSGCCIGRFAGLSPRSWPMVLFAPLGPAPVEARTTCEAFGRPESVAIGAELVLQFEGGDPGMPIVTGVLCPLLPKRATRVHIDGEELFLHGKRRIELSCGDASIVLTANGKVLIKGAEIVSRSSGPNKIRGATVAIN
jgi:hypothetical protein